MGSPEVWAVGIVPGEELGDEDPEEDSWYLVGSCIGSTWDPVSVVDRMASGRMGCVGSNPSVIVCKVADLFPSPFLLSGSGDGVLDLSVGRLSASLHCHFLNLQTVAGDLLWFVAWAGV